MYKLHDVIERNCLTCKGKFSVQYQAVKRDGGKYCNRKCNPIHNQHLKKYVKHPLGAANSKVEVACKKCANKFLTKVKNIARGGGVYCSRNCNPAYAPKFEPSSKYRRYNLKANYGMTVADYDVLAEKQGNKCGICGDSPRGTGRFGRLVVDHDHATGKVRALLCSSCNRALGWFRDDKKILNSAINYLDRYAISLEGD